MVALATLEALLDDLEEGVLVLDEERRIVQINAAAQRLLGLEGRQLVRQLCPTLFEGTPCADACRRTGRCSLPGAHGEMRKTQGRTVQQMALAANTPMMLKAGLVEGDTEAGVLASGQVVGLLEDLPSCEDLIDRVVTQAAAELRRASGMLVG